MPRRRRKKDGLEEIVPALLVLFFFGTYYYTKSFQAAGVLTVVFFGFILGIMLVFLLIEREKLKKSGIHDIDRMNGRQFEKYLELLFRSLGYKTKLTRYVGDYGADLILERDGKRYVVQAKRYKSNVGIQAIQEAAAAVAHYKANEAWVITNSDFTEAAKELAQSNGVRLINRKKLIDLILKMNPQAVPDPKKVIAENPVKQKKLAKEGRLLHGSKIESGDS